MRNNQNKRMRGRNNRGGSSGGGGGGSQNNSNRGHHHNPLTRVYESNGPDVKIRGTAHHVAEKYLQLARDASSSGDPVTAENYYQHAEHYLRLIQAAQDQFRQQNPNYQAPPAPGELSNDGSFEDGDDDGQSSGQSSGQSPGQSAQQPSFNGQQPHQQQPYQPRDQQQPREQQSYQQRDQQPRDTQQRDQQPRDQQPRDQQPPQQYQPREQQPREQQPVRQPQPQYQPQPQPASGFENNNGLPSFITGGQPAPQYNSEPANEQDPARENGDNNGAPGERFPRRRRRHPRGPRPEMTGAPHEVGGE